MTLTLQIENFDVLDDGGPVSVSVPERGIQVGRNGSMDWVLPDASRYISGHHFDVLSEGGQWMLHDRSTNGTFLQGHRHRLDGPHVLRHGDRFQIGHYVVVALVDMPLGGDPMTPSSLPEHRVDRPVVEPVHDDPWAMEPAIPIDVSPREQSWRGADFSSEFLPFDRDASPLPAPPQSSGLPPVVTPATAAQEPDPAAASPANAPPPADPASFVRQFCEGAGLPVEMARDIPADALAHALGQSLRITTEHVMAALQDRAAARHFTKSGQRTMRSMTDNNPLKFLPDATDALDALFLNPRAGFMTGAQGFDTALGDLRRHQSALFAALQPALIGLLEDLDPGKIDGSVKSGGMMGNRKAKAWDEFVSRWDARTASENGILDAFLTLFAEAYRKVHGGPDGGGLS